MTADLSAIRARLAALDVPRLAWNHGQYAAAREDLIAHAPADLAALADEVEALRAAVERVREVLRDPYSVSDFDANCYVSMVKASDIRHALAIDGLDSTVRATDNRLDALVRALRPTRDDNDGDDVLRRCQALIASWGALDGAE